MSVGEEDLQSWGWTDLSSYWTAVSDSDSESGTMSRHSLRLDEGLLDRSLPLGSASFSVVGSGWRNTRALKSRRSQQLSVSCSESVLVRTPRKLPGHSLHSMASDASLLSSLLDESSIQETTVVDTFWGLDQDLDPRESAAMAEHGGILANSTLIAADCRHPEHPVRTLTRVPYRDEESSKPASTIYTRNRSRRVRTGLLGSVWHAGVGAIRRCLAGVFVALLVSYHKRHQVSDVLQLWSASFLFYCRSALISARRLGQVARSKTTGVNGHGRPDSRHCGVMSAKHQDLHANGPLCELPDANTHTGEACQEKHQVSSSSSTMWTLAAFAVWCVRQLTSLVWTLTRTALSSLDRLRRHAGGTLGGAFRRIRRRWSDCPLLTWFVLSVLVLVFSLCCFSPAGFAVPSVREWKTSVSDVPVLSSVHGLVSRWSRAAGGAVEEVTASESARLARLERGMASLWERVESGGRRARRRHGELLAMYSDLKLLGSAHNSKLRLSRLVDQQLSRLKRRLDQDRLQRGQDLDQQQRQASRLDHLEAKMEDVQWRQEATSPPLPAAASVAATHPPSHDALLAEVGRLEAALEDVRRDVEVLSGCQDGCRRLDQISAHVSAQVREEVRVLLYGNDLRVDSAPSERFVSGAELQASLVSLERSILQNISRQLDQRRSEASVTGVVRTEEGGATLVCSSRFSCAVQEVKVMVENALRLFAHDRTGLADYALESAGGSILSTRCSETYKTQAALLSLFGLPLWYFSQSPRVVIQPDVHPGNCWAFKGSTGFLVIRLSMRILPTAFSLDHIPKTLAPHRSVSSAPRDFRVYGLQDEREEGGSLLGSYTYQEDGDALQTYSVTASDHFLYATSCPPRADVQSVLHRKTTTEASRSSRSRSCPTGATRTTRACTASECTDLPVTPERISH
ncbi:SUN domain-containing protein 2-like isoform X2 [Entelurus aequoreus]|uniref:SUN domain-containing protein 2-like isoform X2 n=1 Tax=Entelurus aequoreus TaxID=161455 RepID=UPI002B1D4893|nr:SUN domain-containing protein 2-like isoform X2 [Entelurus aequoreus]